MGNGSAIDNERCSMATFRVSRVGPDGITGASEERVPIASRNNDIANRRAARATPECNRLASAQQIIRQGVAGDRVLIAGTMDAVRLGGHVLPQRVPRN